MADRTLLRLSATLVLIGFALTYATSNILHPPGGMTYEATLAISGSSSGWQVSRRDCSSSSLLWAS